MRDNIIENVLRLLRLEAKKFSLLIELVESLAWKKLKEEIFPREPTIMDREELVKYIPWNFVPSADKHLVARNQAKLKTLKRHITEIQEMLEKVVML